MSLAERLRKNSTVADTAILTDSKIFGAKDMIRTRVPMVNVALSGEVGGGLTPGLTVIAGPSKHFKSAFSLLLASAFLQKYPDGVVMFYDSEFGTPQAYFTTFGIPMSQVLHTPITDIEMLKHDIMQQLMGIERSDRVMIIIDSVGNLASKKEVDDAIEGRSVADMSRAKALKSLFRMITPHLTLKDIPMVVVNHTYKEIGMYPKDVVGGGTGIYYSADTIWIIGRQQDKDGKEIMGYDFIINIEKSRYVKEKSRIPISVSFEGGIDTWSGLWDIATEMGFINRNGAWYTRVDVNSGELEEKKLRREEIESDNAFWNALLKMPAFKDKIRDTYKIANAPIMADEEVNFD